MRINGGMRTEMKVSSGIIWVDGEKLLSILSQTFLETIGRKTSNDDSLVRYFATLAFIQKSDFSYDRLTLLSNEMM